MAIRALFRMSDLPLPLALEFHKIILDSIEDESKPAYEEILSRLTFQKKGAADPEYTAFSNWNVAQNYLIFAKGYATLFKDEPINAVWIAYACLEKIMEITNDAGEAGYLQEFHFRRKKFWVILQEDHKIVFLLPEEY